MKMCLIQWGEGELVKKVTWGTPRNEDNDRCDDGNDGDAGNEWRKAEDIHTQ